MGNSPRRAATPERRPRQTARRAVRRPRGRTGLVVAGIAVLVAAGGVLLPQVLPGRTTAPVASSSPQTTDPDTPPRAVARPARDAIREASEPLDTAPAARAQVLSEVTFVAGIPEPCSPDLIITDSMSAAEITSRAEAQWGFPLTGPQWRDDAYRPVVKLFAETLDSVDCTDYLNRVKAGNGGKLEVSSLPTRSWAWGDYGLTRPNVLTLDFAKFKQGYADGDRGRLVRLIIHEMAHSLNADRFSEPAYWTAFNRVWASNGPVSAYGSVPTESFADAVGYYVARCAADNPYDTRQHQAYYDYVKTNIFAGREFGGAVGVPAECAIKGR